MTSEQKLDIVYKKLVHSKARTKDGIVPFEEPFSRFRQVPSPYVYVNSDAIPSEAPLDDITFNGVLTLKYVKDDLSSVASLNGKSYKLSYGKIIPASYGNGYGIVLKTQEGRIIDPIDFPFYVDYESGLITFDDSEPFDVSMDLPPVANYYSYTGRTLGAIQTYNRIGQRGVAGPTGPNGPKDTSTMIYRGSTDFSVSGTQYHTNDVITYTVDGNSYVCLQDTDGSPDDVPSFWECISPSGNSGYMPSRVLYVSDATLVPTGDFFVSGGTHYTALQDAIDSCENGIWTTIMVNQMSNEAPLGGSFLISGGKKINLIFKKYASVFNDAPTSVDFSFSVVDSEVVVENARIGGDKVYTLYPIENNITVSAETQNASLKFINCRINSNRVIATAGSTYDATLHFDRSHVNPLYIVSNSIIKFDSSLAFCAITLDASSVSDVGKTHELTIRNTKFFNRMGDGRLATEPKDVIILARRDDFNSFYVQTFNSLLPSLCVKILPETQSISYDTFYVYSDNSIFFEVRLDTQSTNQSARLVVVGGNNLNFDNTTTDRIIEYRPISNIDLILTQEFSKRTVEWDSPASSNPKPIDSYFSMATQWNILSI